MLDRQKGKIVFECDVCGDVLETDTSDFREALNALDAENWKAKCIATVWNHSCSKCGVPGTRAPFARQGRGG